MSTTTLILLLLAVLVGIPLLTLVHELGHALVAAALVGAPVRVVQGPEPRPFAFSVGPLDLRLHGLVAPQRSWIGWASWPSHPARLRHALALAAGPTASLAASASLAVAAAHVSGAPRPALVLLAADAGLQALSSGLPVRYPSFSGVYAGTASDGFKIVSLLAGKWTTAPVNSAAAAALRPRPARPVPSAPDRAVDA